MSELKLCIDCRWCWHTVRTSRLTMEPLHAWNCQHPTALVPEEVDLVTGEIAAQEHYRLCSDVRRSAGVMVVGLCGEAGEFWEPIPEANRTGIAGLEFEKN